jgi:hypothetical protein
MSKTNWIELTHLHAWMVAGNPIDEVSKALSAMIKHAEAADAALMRSFADEFNIPIIC